MSYKIYATLILIALLGSCSRESLPPAAIPLTHQSSFYTGDVTGDSREEIIIAKPGSLAVYDLSGALLHEIHMEKVKWGEALITDLNEDGKKDIVIGGRDTKSTTIYGFSGVLDELFTYKDSRADHEAYNVVTHMREQRDNLIFYTSYSFLHTSPRITGAFNLETGQPEWIHYTGSVPTGITLNEATGLLALSNLPKSANGVIAHDKNFPDKNQHAVYINLLNNQGEEALKVPLGPDYHAGEIMNMGISSLDLNFFSEGNLIIALNRISPLYKGPAKLQLRDLKGELLKSHSFSPETALDFQVMREGDETRIIVFEKQRNRLTLLDEDLKVLQEKQEKNTIGEGYMHQADESLLVSWNNEIRLYDRNLHPVFFHSFDSPVIKARLLFGKKQSTLIVQANDLHILPLEKQEEIPITEQLPATYSNSTRSQSERHLVQGDRPDTPLKNWSDLTLKKQRDIPAHLGPYHNLVYDVTGDEAEELLFRDRSRNTIHSFDTDMNELARFVIPWNYVINEPIRTGDKFNFLMTSRWGDYRMSLYNAEGQLLNFMNSGLHPEAYGGYGDVLKTRLYLSVSSGYALQPRGLYSFDMKTNRMLSYSPMAVSPNGVMVTEEAGILVAQHTVSNNARIVYPDGQVATDHHFFIQRTDLNGNYMPESFNPELEYNSGYTRWFTADMNEDRVPEIYMIGNRSSYYPGPVQLFSFNAEANRLEGPLFEGFEDVQFYAPYLIRFEDRPALVFQTQKTRDILILDRNFSIILRRPMDEGVPNQRFLHHDMNGDGTDELFLVIGGDVEIRTPTWELLHTIKPEKPVIRAALIDEESDGKTDLLLFSEKHVSTWSY